MKLNILKHCKICELNGYFHLYIINANVCSFIAFFNRKKHEHITFFISKNRQYTICGLRKYFPKFYYIISISSLVNIFLQ